mmetsp:Transcript_10003/g.33060  ORF Transcript_10003/g.33060 Transcript_10003/m.33060 type:complete len:215 (-) Transcript_10003:255-899(-)
MSGRSWGTRPQDPSPPSCEWRDVSRPTCGGPSHPRPHPALGAREPEGNRSQPLSWYFLDLYGLANAARKQLGLAVARANPTASLWCSRSRLNRNQSVAPSPRAGRLLSVARSVQCEPRRAVSALAAVAQRPCPSSARGRRRRQPHTCRDGARRRHRTLCVCVFVVSNFVSVSLVRSYVSVSAVEELLRIGRPCEPAVRSTFSDPHSLAAHHNNS